MASIAELLELLNKSTEVSDIKNSWDIWNRINDNEGFDSLGFKSQEQMDEWKENNPYTDLA